MSQSSPPVRFEVLGPLRAWRGDQALDLGPGKQQAVLAVLLLHSNRPVRTTSIVDAVWREDPPDNGANVVQKYVAGLRRVLEPDRSPRAPARVLELTAGGYVLHVPPDGLDADVFRERVRRALAARAAVSGPETAARLEEALALWQDTPLAGFTGPVFEAARDRLVEDRAAALETCAEIELELGRHARLVPELIRLVGDFPLREEPRYLLMLALYRCGRQAEALAAFRDARDFLAEEFGIEPGERLQDLHVRMLRSDPSLLSWTPPPSPMREIPAALRPAPLGWHAQVDGRVPVDGPAQVDGVERRVSWELRIAMIAVPMLTCGTFTWALVAYFAGRRRSPWLGLASAGWLAMTVFTWMVMTSGNPELRPVDGWAMAAGMVSAVGGSVHVALLTSWPWPFLSHDDRAATTPAVPDSRVVELIQRGTRRDQARGLLLHHPSVARELGIGRPDLPRTFDDGGLVDVNAVPEHVLAMLPGLGPREARLIVTIRDAQGPFVSIDDVIRRGVLPPDAISALYEILVAVPPSLEDEVPHLRKKADRKKVDPAGSR